LINVNKWNYENEEVITLENKELNLNTENIYDQLLKEQDIELSFGYKNNYNKLKVFDEIDTDLSYNYGIHIGNSIKQIGRVYLKKEECNYFYTFETINIVHIFEYIDDENIIRFNKNYKDIKKYVIDYIGHDFINSNDLDFGKDDVCCFNYVDMMHVISEELIKNNTFSKYDRIEQFNIYDIEYIGERGCVSEDYYQIRLIRRIKKYYKKLKLIY
jgi:hypothetical protein